MRGAVGVVGVQGDHIVKSRAADMRDAAMVATAIKMDAVHVAANGMTGGEIERDVLDREIRNAANVERIGDGVPDRHP